jgi:centromeric protein E
MYPFFCQLEKQLMELMEEKDTVQSQLNCLLKGEGDDHNTEHTARQWVFVLLHIPASP